MAILYSSKQGVGINLPFDPDNKEFYTLVYRPETWSANKEIIEGDLIVIPSIPNGCMYQSVQGGITGVTEPVWPTSKGSIINSGNVKFKTLPYNLQLRTGDNIEANVGEGWPAYELILPVDVTVDSVSLISGRLLKFRVTAMPSTGSINIIARISVKKASNIYARYDNTISLTAKQN